MKGWNLDLDQIIHILKNENCHWVFSYSAFCFSFCFVHWKCFLVSRICSFDRKKIVLAMIFKVAFQCNSSQKYLFVNIARSFSRLNLKRPKAFYITVFLKKSVKQSVGCFKFNMGSIQPEVCQAKCQLMQGGKSFPDVCFIFCSNMK